MGTTFPCEWTQPKLEDVVEILDSMRVPINNSERQSRIEGKSSNELFPYYGATGEVGKIDNYIFDEELVALGEDGVPFLDHLKPKAYLLEGKTWVNNHAHVLKGWPRGLSNKLLLNYLNQFDYQGYVNGGTRLKLTQANMRKIPVPLPPLAEQKVIADKLDTLLAQVENTKARLERIPKILKTFRQSVLAAAVSGKLTEEWRGSCGTKLEKFSKESPLSEFRGKVLPLLPESWQWLRFDQVADIASNLVSPLDKPEAIHIAPNHIESWTGIASGFQTVAADGVTSAKHQFTQGQIIYSKIRPYLAKVTIAEFDGLCSADMYPVNSRINTSYIFRWMLTSEFTDWASNAESRSVLPKINQKDLSKIPVPTPPLEEQTQIVRRVEELFAFADNIEQKANAALERVNNLTQSILAKAFRGELTAEWRAQNPELISGDNSAEALLTKIKAERAAMKPSKKTSKKKT